MRGYVDCKDLNIFRHTQANEILCNRIIFGRFVNKNIGLNCFQTEVVYTFNGFSKEDKVHELNGKTRRLEPSNETGKW